MVDETTTQELLSFFKALADANRLKIVGLLAQESLSVEQLAEMLEIHPSTVSHHLSRLSKAGLVSARAEGYYSIYALETKALERMAQRLLERDTLPAVASEIDIDAYDRKVLNTFMTPDGRLKAFPSQLKKLEVIVRYVARAFETGRRYSEKEVNERLSQFHEDYASLRRHLVEFKLLEREGGGGAYWLVGE
jgi:predicted transcriptional regulator